MPIGSFSITNKSGAPLTAGFYPGQVIEGLVSLTVTDEHMKCKGRYLKTFLYFFGPLPFFCKFTQPMLLLECET